MSKEPKHGQTKWVEDKFPAWEGGYLNLYEVKFLFVKHSGATTGYWAPQMNHDGTPIQRVKRKFDLAKLEVDVRPGVKADPPTVTVTNN